MNPEEIIKAANEDGVRITLSDDGLKAGGNQEGLDAWLPILREHKPGIIAELHRQRRRAKVMAMLDDKKYAVYVEDDTTDPVICAVAIRGIASFELEIPKKYYNAVALIELVERHASETRPLPSQSSGNAIVLPKGHGRSQAHPKGAA